MSSNVAHKVLEEAAISEQKKAAGKVLVVDDDAVVRRAYGRFVRFLGHGAEMVESGELALVAMAAGRYDMVLLDVMMPGMGGMGLLKALRQRGDQTPVVLVTAAPKLEGAQEACELQALRYLTKPVNYELLGTVIARAIGESQKRARPGHDDRAALSERFDEALSSLWMAYQPIVSWGGRSIHAYEALVRTGKGGFARPDELFDCAEKLERLPEIGRAIRRRVAQSLPTATDSETLSFVNLHPFDLTDDDLFDPGAPLSAFASQVVLEITERAALTRVDDVRTKIERLRRLGYRVALDDLGSGYAGLSAMAQLRPDLIKIDMSLVRDIDQDSTKQAVVRTLVTLARELSIAVVTEGVETVAERDVLISLGCDLLQGYLFGRPQPKRSVVAF